MNVGFIRELIPATYQDLPMQSRFAPDYALPALRRHLGGVSRADVDRDPRRGGDGRRARGVPRQGRGPGARARRRALWRADVAIHARGDGHAPPRASSRGPYARMVADLAEGILTRGPAYRREANVPVALLAVHRGHQPTPAAVGDAVSALSRFRRGSSAQAPEPIAPTIPVGDDPVPVHPSVPTPAPPV